MRSAAILFSMAVSLAAQVPYDLLLQGGHVIDPKNGVNRVMDVAIAGGRIAAVAEKIPAAQARRVANVSGLYVTPGLIDIHVHVYAGTGLKALTGDQSVYPDPLSFRTGVTTMVDAGTAGWRNFPDFRQRVIDRARTRVLAFINVGGVGMAPSGENDPQDMDVAELVKVARANSDIVVGYKVAHYRGGDWLDVDRAVEAGNQTKMPVMVDFGFVNEKRNLGTLLLDKLRPGDIYTHCYSGHRGEVVDGKLNPAMPAARKRGVIFDVGHGGGSFYWYVAMPAFQAGFWPDSISTDLHTGSMNAGMKDMANVMSKMLNAGMPLTEVIRTSTWQPAQIINRKELGHLDKGAVADVTVLAVEKGNFGFVDAGGGRLDGTQRIVAEMTIRNGAVVWDLNGRSAENWKVHKYQQPSYRAPKK
jgi:dihydroorotase